MRNVRKVVLLAAMALEAMALGASSASAQVTVSAEPGTACPAVTNVGHDPAGGCAIHAVSVGTANLFQHITTPVVAEVLFSECANEFDAVVDGAGTGYIFNQSLTPVAGQGPCGIQPCDEAETGATPHEDLPWPVRVEEGAANQFTLHVVFCTRLNSATTGEGTGNPCEVRIPITRTEAPQHHYRFGPVVQTPCINLGGAIELSGEWVTEENAGGDIEISHAG